MPCAYQEDHTHNAAHNGDTNFVIPDCLCNDTLNVLLAHLIMQQMNGG